MDENEIIQEEAPEVVSDDLESTTEDTAQVASLEIPESWGNDLKEFITGIEDEKARMAHYDKFKSFNDGYQKKYDTLANERKEYEAKKAEMETSNHFYSGYKALEATIDPKYKGAIEGQYGGLPQYYKWLHEQDVAISEDPTSYALRLLESQGITRDNVAQAFDAPNYHATKQQNDLGQFKEQLTQQTQQMMTDWQMQQQINSFVNATDETGQPKHPHFSKVETTMANLKPAYPQASLEQLYDMACRADPEISQTYLQSKVSQQAEKIVNEKEVVKAKQAKGVVSSVDSVGKTEKLSWRDQLSAQIEAG